MIATIFGIMFLVAIYYFDKAKSEKKEKEKLQEKSSRENELLNIKLKQLENEKRASQLKDFSKHSSEIESLKTEILDLNILLLKDKKFYAEFRDIKGQKYLIENFEALNFLENIILPISKEHHQLSDLTYLEWFEGLGEGSFYDKKQRVEFEKLDEIEELDMSKIKRGRFNVLQRLDNTWYVINSIDSELNIDFSIIVKNYIKLKIARVVNEENTMPNNV